MVGNITGFHGEFEVMTKRNFLAALYKSDAPVIFSSSIVFSFGHSGLISNISAVSN